MKLADFLKQKGYAVPGTERVDYEINEIRYFHESDLKGAEYLQDHTIDFFESQELNNLFLPIKFYQSKFLGKVSLTLQR